MTNMEGTLQLVTGILIFGAQVPFSVSGHAATPWSPICPPKCYCYGQVPGNTFTVNCSRTREGPFPVNEIPADTAYLDLSLNMMGGLPKGAFDGLHLKGVWLQSNKLSDSNVPQDVFEPLTAIETIDLSLNEFKSIPRKLSSSLSRLIMQWNKVDHVLPDDLQGFIHLSFLDLSNNNISYLPPKSLMHQSLLTDLRISFNPLNDTGIPPGVFESASKLQSLELRSDSLTTVPADLPQSITDLDLGYNSIGRLTAKMFSGLPKLTTLRLNSNQIEVIEQNAFDGVDRLLQLSLLNNKLASLQAGSFTGLRALQSLDLSSNHIESMADGVFSPLVSVTMIDLVRNQLQTLQYEVLYNPSLANLTTLFLYDNPWNCDCNLRWLRALMDLRPSLVALSELVTCSLPTDLKGITWDLIFPDDFRC